MTTDLKTRTPSTLVHSDDLTRGTATDLGPMLADWIATDARVVAPAVELADALSRCELSRLSPTQTDLAAAVAELADAAGLHWPNAADDPTVVLVRVIARIATLAPHATSVHAATVMEQLPSDR